MNQSLLISFLFILLINVDCNRYMRAIFFFFFVAALSNAVVPRGTSRLYKQAGSSIQSVVASS
jgi:hypothetical protein